MLSISSLLSAQSITNANFYTVAHNNGANNVLYKLDAQTNQWAEVGVTNTNSIKAMAANPINNTIYAVDKDTFGTINATTGLFTPIGIIGQANGDIGEVNLNNIEGLTYDLVNNVAIAIHRIESGGICDPTPNSSDLLFKIDVLTGKFVPNAMQGENGDLADYGVVMQTAINTTAIENCSTAVLSDINDIAYNAYTNELYAIQNQEFTGVISILNKVDASVEAVIYNYENADLLGLTFNSLGELFATTGAHAINETANGLKYIDLQNQQTANLPPINVSAINFDFTSLICIMPSNDLALSLTTNFNTANSISIGEEVSFLVNVYNQGELINNNIIISNYIPEGLLLNDVNWTKVPGTNIAEYQFNEVLTPSTNFTVPINFIVDATFTGSEIVNSAEITTSNNDNITDFNGDPLPLSDVDSTPDDINNELLNGGIVVDDAIDGAGPSKNEDEDDHDIATITLIPPVTENLLLKTATSPATCNRAGAAQISILANGVAPFSYKWLNQFDTVIREETNSNFVHVVIGLPADIYNLIVSDATGKVNESLITIPQLSSNNGNLNCEITCPKNLATPNDLLHGVFQAEGTIEINGEITGFEDTEFRICD